MNQIKELILNALEYADVNKEKYSTVLKKSRYVSIFSSTKDMVPSTITFYDKGKKPMFTSRFEILGEYIHDSNIWLWAWAQPTLPKNQTYLSKKILNYGLNIDPTENLVLKTELVTSRFKVFDDVQLDMHVALSSYIAKAPFIFDLYRVHNHKTEILGSTILFHLENKDSESYVRYVLILLDQYNPSNPSDQ